MSPFSSIAARRLLLAVTASAALLGGCANMNETQRGTAIGAGVGAVAGGVIGHGRGAVIGAGVGALGGYAAVSAGDPQYDYWRDNHVGQPGYVDGYNYEDDYAPAYRLGYQGRERYAGRAWDQTEADLQRDWESVKGKSRLTWEQARAAACAMRRPRRG